MSELRIVTPQRVARGQRYHAHLKLETPEKGPAVYRALCGALPSSGWSWDRVGLRCARCEEKAAKLVLPIPPGWFYEPV